MSPPSARSGIRRPPAAGVLLLLAALLLLGMALAASLGSTPISLETEGRVLLHALRLGPANPADGTAATILLTLRFPQVVAAAVVGAALATSGVLFQGLLRNPLADPYVVGTSGGAMLGAVLGMLLGAHWTLLGFGLVPAAAFAGAVGTTALVLQLSTVGGRLPVVSVLLAGFAVSTLLGYTVSLLLLLSERLQLQLRELYGWLLGGVAVIGWTELRVILPLVLVATLLALSRARVLNAFSLGEDGAARLGIAVEAEKRWIMLLGALLTAAAVSISGLIGFVGLVVPHIVRLLIGPDHRLLLPASALAGALFLVLADLLARTVLAPSVVPVGIVTAFLGGPFFLWLLRRGRKEYQW